LIIFAKEPAKGKVKTRLKTCLSDEGCVNLYKAFLKDTICLAKTVECENKIIAFDAGPKSPQYLKKTAHSFRFYKQQGKNLGERMHQAFRFAVQHNATQAVIIGTDSPTLPAHFITQAFRKLCRNDLVLGPSFDGGYYLIGLKKPCAGLFKGIKWSQSNVLEKTVKNARTLQKKVAFLEKWYDVDRSKNLIYLMHDLKNKSNKFVAKWTRRFLKESTKSFFTQIHTDAGEEYLCVSRVSPEHLNTSLCTY
jgi:hypothetical protein